MLAAPVALASLLDGSRQCFKSRVGTDLTQTPRAALGAAGARRLALESELEAAIGAGQLVLHLQGKYRPDGRLAGARLSIARQCRIARVAEGVETTEQVDFLAAPGCDLRQGFLFGRPKLAADFVAASSGTALD